MSIDRIPLEDLTEAKVDGGGAFDVLMQAAKSHLDQEFKLNRIRGPEYSTVYLGAMESVLQYAVQFLIEGRKAALEAELIAQQILLTQAEVEKAQAQVLLIQQQTANALAEHALITQNADKIAAEIRNLDANTSLVILNHDKVPVEIDHILAQISLTEANILKIPAETAHVEAQTELVEGQISKIPSELLHLESQTSLIEQQTVNAVTENTTMLKQQCKLDAEFDLLKAQELKTGAETTVLTHKAITEQAQVSSAGVDPDSVIGKQKQLYQAQTDGFARDAEQSAAKLLVDTWSVRRTTDEDGTSANSTNKLDDATIGRAISKLLSGVGA